MGNHLIGRRFSLYHLFEQNIRCREAAFQLRSANLTVDNVRGTIMESGSEPHGIRHGSQLIDATIQFHTRFALANDGGG